MESASHRRWRPTRLTLAGGLSLVFLIVFVGLVGFATTGSGTASAAEYTTIYCLNGVSTTLPADVVASSETAGTFTWSFDEAAAAAVLAAEPGGMFWLGYVTGAGWYWLVPSDGYAPDEVFEPGYSTNFIALGACDKGPGSPTHVGVCKMLKRGDGALGMFQEITVAQWNDKDGQYFDAPAANWVEGMGLTCDNPIAMGYKAAGYNVAWGGKPDPTSDPKGVRGSGLNNIYPYFTK